MGDALGYGVEFDRLARIRERFGPDGIREPVLNRRGEAEVSDDTQMTLFTLAGVGGHRPGRRIRPGGRARSGPAGDARLVAPAGLFPGLSRGQAFDLAARRAAQTHGHPSGYLGAGAMAAIVRGLLDGLEPAAAADRALDLARGWREAGETVGAVEGALALAGRADAGRARAVVRLGEGWVGEEALAIGLYAALVGGDFRDAVRVAGNHDGDSDSTASIAGQIYGAWKGMGEIPDGWARRLDVLEPLLDVAGRLIGFDGRE